MSRDPLLRATTDPGNVQATVLKDLQVRVATLERHLGQDGPLGFRVYRNNDIIYNSGVSGDIPFEKVLQFKGTWVDSDTKAAASEFTVPAGGAGLYVLAGGAYWGSGNGVYLAVTVNDVAVAGAIPTGDRHWTCAPYFLNVGDRVSLWINNQSGGNRTVTFIGGDAQTPISPFLAVWRT